MKKALSFVCFCLANVFVYAQTTTLIDYSYEALSSTSCNVFSTNTVIDGYNHLTTLSRPKFSDDAIKLECKPNNSSTVLSTIYSINYNFKQGYNYKIS